MPSLLLFAPCERVAFDQKENAASLINIFQGFNVTLVEHPLTQPVQAPVDAYVVAEKALPIRWAIFTLWRKMDDDENRTFVQTCELVSPSGRQSFQAKLDFKMTHSFQRNIMNVMRFPVDEAGQYTIRLFLKVNQAEPELKATYPVFVTHITDEASRT